jgi:hypothetical protein
MSIPAPLQDRAVQRWETDGGATLHRPVTAGATQTFSAPAETSVSRSMWDFLVPSGRFRIGFNQVYRTAGGAEPQRDDDRCHWAVQAGGDVPGPRTGVLTFARAREELWPQLTFDQFASVAFMRARLPTLLGAAPSDDVAQPLLAAWWMEDAADGPWSQPESASASTP